MDKVVLTSRVSELETNETMLRNKVRELEESRKRSTTEAADTQRIQDLERTHVRDVNNLTSQLRQYQLWDKESKEKAEASALKVWTGLSCVL